MKHFIISKVSKAVVFKFFRRIAKLKLKLCKQPHENNKVFEKNIKE